MLAAAAGVTMVTVVAKTRLALPRTLAGLLVLCAVVFGYARRPSAYMRKILGTEIRVSAARSRSDLGLVSLFPGCQILCTGLLLENDCDSTHFLSFQMLWIAR
eukprot:SAG31_NODE_67_length_28318_cov_6.493674_12_plen_103_part_00